MVGRTSSTEVEERRNGDGRGKETTTPRLTLREVDGRHGASAEEHVIQVGDEGRRQGRRMKREERRSSKAKEDLIFRTFPPRPVTRGDVGLRQSCRTRADSSVLLLLSLQVLLPRLLRIAPGRSSSFPRRKPQDDPHLLLLPRPAQGKEDDSLHRPSLDPKGGRKDRTTCEGGLGTDGKDGWDELELEEEEEEDGSHQRRIFLRRDSTRERSSLRTWEGE